MDTTEETKIETPAQFKTIVEAIEKLSVLELNELVKFFEKKTGIFGITEGSDDIALAFWGEEFAKAEFAHSGDQCLVIRAVALGSRSDASFLAQFLQRLRKGEQGVRRRRETELSVVFKTFPLGKEIKDNGMRIAF